MLPASSLCNKGLFRVERFQRTVVAEYDFEFLGT